MCVKIRVYLERNDYMEFNQLNAVNNNVTPLSTVPEVISPTDIFVGLATIYDKEHNTTQKTPRIFMQLHNSKLVRVVQDLKTGLCCYSTNGQVLYDATAKIQFQDIEGLIPITDNVFQAHFAILGKTIKTEGLLVPRTYDTILALYSQLQNTEDQPHIKH